MGLICDLNLNKLRRKLGKSGALVRIDNKAHQDDIHDDRRKVGKCRTQILGEVRLARGKLFVSVKLKVGQSTARLTERAPLENAPI